MPRCAAALFVLSALVAGCADGDGDSVARSSTTAPGSQEGSAPVAVDCAPGDPVPVDGEGVGLQDVGEQDGVRVEAAAYPHPDYDAQLWSQWGQGVVLPDGRFVSAIGDHAGEDGNSYFYEYDPTTGELTMTADVLSVADHDGGDWGYGKIHAPLLADPCGTVWATTYWGSARDIRYGGSYQGDLLLRYDPAAHELERVTVPADGHGLPSAAAWFAGGLLYAEALVGEAGADEGERHEKRGSFIVWDLDAGEVRFEDASTPHVGYRSILVDAGGLAYFAAGDGVLSAYDPERNSVEANAVQTPGGWLRAATHPAPDGSVYGVTRNPEEFFALRPDGSVDALGAAQDYTASLALDPSGSRFFYVPGAHGTGPEQGTPLIAVDADTGEQQVLVRLNDLIEPALGLTVGGSYNLAVAPDGRTVYVGLNAGPEGSDEPFGEVVLAVVHLPS